MPCRLSLASLLSLALILVFTTSCTPKSSTEPDTDGAGSSGGATTPPPPMATTAPPPASVVVPAPPEASVSAPVRPAPPPRATRVPSEKTITRAPSSESVTGPIRSLGHILYNPPTEMTLNVAETVEIRIAKDEVSDKGLSGGGSTQREIIPISQTMSVRLCCGDSSKGDPFDITTASAEEQLVNDPLLAEGEFTEWVFQVTPREKGEQQLKLFVTAHYTLANGRKIPKDEVLSRNIVVQVDAATEAWRWVVENWYWLGLLLVIPLAALLLNRRNQASNITRVPSGNESVFISYRRNDSSGHTLAVYEKLKSAMGDEHVFMDLDDIPHGVNFAEHIEKVLAKANTMLVMIGPDWLHASNAQGRRLDDPQDFVRMEVATALQQDLRVVPVLLRGAEMPLPEDLPDVLQGLSLRNAIRIYDDQFDAGIQRLIESMTD